MFPILPDPDSDTELWIGIAILNALSGLRSGWGMFALVLLVGAVIVHALLEFLKSAITRLFTIYRTHMHGTGRTARWLHGTLLVFLAVSLLAVILISQPETYGLGWDLLAVSFLLFTLVSEIIVYLAERNRQSNGAQLPHNISLRNVVSWHKTVEESKQP